MTTIVSSTLEVLSGQTSSGLDIIAGAHVVVDASGTVIGTIIGNGGNQIVGSGGTASGTLVSSGGFDSVGGGTASNTSIGAGGFELVSRGGTAVGTIVGSGGTEIIFAPGQVDGGQESGLVLSSGGVLLLNGVVGLSASLSGDELSVLSSGGTVASLSLADVASGQAFQVIDVGGSATEIALSGTVVPTIVDGVLTVSSGQTSSGLEVIFPGQNGELLVNSGGVVSGTVLDAGAHAFVAAGGSAISTIVSHGGFADISAGGVASGTVVSSGGIVELTLAGKAAWHPTGSNIVDGVTISAGALVELVVASGGTLSGFVGSAGNEFGGGGFFEGGDFIEAGGHASRTILRAFARETVAAGGSATSTTVSGGATEMVDGGGTTVHLTISSGGFAEFNPGSHESGTVLLAGGEIFVEGVTALSASVKGGVLSLLSSGATVETLSLAGVKAGQMFAVSAGNGGTTIAAVGTPTLKAPASVRLTSGVAGAVKGLTLAETNPIEGATFTVTLSDSHGLLSASGGVSGAGTTKLTITGSLSQVNSGLATVTDSDATIGKDTITVTVSGNGDTAAVHKVAVTVPTPPRAGVAVPIHADSVNGGAVSFLGGAAEASLTPLGGANGAGQGAFVGEWVTIRGTVIASGGIGGGGALEASSDRAGSPHHAGLIEPDHLPPIIPVLPG